MTASRQLNGEQGRQIVFEDLIKHVVELERRQRISPTKIVPTKNFALDADVGALLLRGEVPYGLDADGFHPLDMLLHHRAAQPEVDERGVVVAVSTASMPRDLRIILRGERGHLLLHEGAAHFCFFAIYVPLRASAERCRGGQQRAPVGLWGRSRSQKNDQL